MKNKRVTITLTDEEFEQIEKIADFHDWSFSKAGRYYFIELGKDEGLRIADCDDHI